MGGLNARKVLNNILYAQMELKQVISDMNSGKDVNFDRIFCLCGYGGWNAPNNTKNVFFKVDAVAQELSIFDWYKKTLSMRQLKDMEKFLCRAIELGFTGYVCFRVGAKGCANGMWAFEKESEDGYSPAIGRALYHSFVSGENTWDLRIGDVWLKDKGAKLSFKDVTNIMKAEREADSLNKTISF